jgi:hypothetical protein
MVKQNRSLNTEFPNVIMPPPFEVFEAAQLGSGRAHWRKVDTLTRHALFLSQGCSESLPADQGQCSGPQEDCIYFLSNYYMYTTMSSGMYNMREGRLSPLPFEIVVAEGGRGTATWLFPADT